MVLLTMPEKKKIGARRGEGGGHRWVKAMKYFYRYFKMIIVMTPPPTLSATKHYSKCIDDLLLPKEERSAGVKGGNIFIACRLCAKK